MSCRWLAHLSTDSRCLSCAPVNSMELVLVIHAFLICVVFHIFTTILLQWFSNHDQNKYEITDITTLNHVTCNCQTWRETNVILWNSTGPTTVEHSSKVYSYTVQSLHHLNLSNVIHMCCDISWVKLNYCYRQVTATFH
jgi:hypothetical protein